MHLKKLEIFGFKSFADKTILNFEKGITAIVGPNGCGKSNIFDSIRWVLGEQSVKELRGGSMEDVIFNGTDKKSGLGFAEVSLTFSNESKSLPVEYDEVTVSRRLFRSGESEYLLNKTVVRLKDILELFMGTGVGAEAYSLVQQGKVDLIVSARPEDRRVIIDEASGITKYKSKKKEALNKLKDTDNNLLRINDIILEVKRQISSLERQANKARKYKEEMEKLKTAELKLAKYHLDDYSTVRQQLSVSLDAQVSQEEKLRQAWDEHNRRRVQEDHQMTQLEQKISENHEEGLKIENEGEMNRRQINFNRERIEELNLAEGRLIERRKDLQERCQTEQEKISLLSEELVALLKLIEKNTAELHHQKERLTTVASTIKEKREIIKKEEECILGLTSQQVSIKNELTEVMKEFQGALARKRRLEIEQAKVVSEKEEIDNKLMSISEDINNCSQKIDSLKNKLESKNLIGQQLQGQLDSLEQTLKELERKRLFLNSQRSFIEELRVQYQDMPDPVVEGTLLTKSAPMEKGKGIIGKVKEVRQLTPERLEALRQNLVQINGDNTLYEIICETKFIELDPEKISIQIDELTGQINDCQRHKEELLSQIKENQSIIESLNGAIHDQEKIYSRYEAQKNNVLEESSKLLSELDLIESEIREARNTMASLKNKENEFNGQLDEINEKFQSTQQDIRVKQEEITSLSHEKEEATIAIAQLETEIKSYRDKEASQQGNFKMFEESLANNLQEVQTLERETEENQEKRREYKQQIEQLEVKIGEIENKKESLRVILDELEEQKTEIAGRIREVGGKLQSIEEEIAATKNRIHEYQMKQQEISFNEKSIKDRLIQTYKINYDEVSIEPEAEYNIEELESSIERLKKRCDSFGSVNLVAIEEFDQLRERFEFLTKQQCDLITAKESLHKTISKINKTTRQMFMETFTRVSEEFRIYFRMLFGGGEAQLLLVDPENVLESGIEIIARPPGKKLQNITLLSGGEKSLAAIALIFGVFKVRPSPFCILDEIDAALDESNVGRFGYLLKDFSKISQFIVITHNKKTISNANVMYGITMQETGISRIVSVKLAEEEQEIKEEVPVGAI